MMFLHTKKMNVRSTEYLVGLGTALIVSIIVNILNIVSIYGFQVDPRQSSIIFLKVIGVAMGYTADILFAKQDFDGEIVPYKDLSRRVHLFWKSLFSFQFVKFIMVSILSAFVFYSTYGVALRIANRIEQKPKYWRYALASGISISSFILIVNPLRFLWAYRENLSLPVELSVGGIIILLYIAYGIGRHYKLFDDDSKSGNEREHDYRTTMF